jgi:hypothetical protein
MHIQCGHMHRELGEFDEAVIHYQRAKELRPADPNLAFLLGNLWKRPSVVERDKMSRVVDWCALVWGDEAADIGDGRV